MLRAGAGVFFDTAANASAAAIGPYSPSAFHQLLRFPVTAADAQSLVAPEYQTDVSPTNPYRSAAIAAAPDLRLPRTYQFNVAVQQALGRQQSLTVSYVGATGRDLIGATSAIPQTWALNGEERTYFISSTFSGSQTTLTAFGNYARSNYNALQAQFQRQFVRGLSATGSYTWAHSRIPFPRNLAT